VITGRRIRLRGLERSDLPKLQEWLNDEQVSDGISIYVPLSMAEEERWFDRMMQLDLPERPMAIDLQEGSGWRLIGDIGFFHIEWDNRCAEFGIAIADKSVWNKGYGTEAVELLLRHGFESLNLHRIYLRVFSTNPRAKRSYEKAGFVLEGTQREAVYRHGKYADVHMMSVLRPEWDAAVEGK
jgi:RimJ/RimL family protein N-acetyltransferase